MGTPRILSLLPSATEIVAALGASEHLVGVSHACDYPTAIAATSLPRVTRPRAELAAATCSVSIDAAVGDIIKAGLSCYDLDLAALAAARPDLVLTQDLCDVCGVDRDTVQRALAEILGGASVRVINLAPRDLASVWADIATVGDALGLGMLGQSIVTGLEARVDVVRQAVRNTATPKVVAVEWVSPLMVAGLWMPDIIRAAGGEPVGPTTGETGRPVPLETILAAKPDVVFVKPCGFDLAETRRAMADLAPELRQVGRVFIADGNAYFNRPGPRLADSVEILAACLHPDAVPQLVRRHAGRFAAWTEAAAEV